MFFFCFVLNVILAWVFLFVRAPSPCSDAKLIPPCCSLSFLCWIKDWGEEKNHRSRNISILHVFVFFFVAMCSVYFICVLFISCDCWHSIYADAYSNIERSYIGNNFELEILPISIWHCLQTPSHWKGHITCGTLHVLFLLSFCLLRIL